MEISFLVVSVDRQPPILMAVQSRYRGKAQTGQKGLESTSDHVQGGAGIMNLSKHWIKDEVFPNLVVELGPKARELHPIRSSRDS